MEFFWTVKNRGQQIIMGSQNMEKQHVKAWTTDAQEGFFPTYFKFKAIETDILSLIGQVVETDFRK